MANITVLGSGGFGTALAVLADKIGHQVTLWSPFEEEITTIRRDGENRRLLPGIVVPASITLTTDLSNVCGTDLVLFAVPSFAVRETAQKIKDLIRPETIVANVAKGFEPNTLNRLSMVLAQEMPHNPIVVLTGPSHAEEVALEIPTTIVAASTNRLAAEEVQELLMGRNLRIYCSDDVIGCELGGALKNIIALAAGICDGLRLGDNAKAALMTRGIAEIARLGVAWGAKTETFSGLSGIGDLIVTCTSMHSRNRRAGILIGEGISAEEAVRRIGMTVEGYLSSRSAYMLAQQMRVEMPIIEQVYAILYEGKAATEAVKALMERPKRHESELVWLLSSY